MVDWDSFAVLSATGGLPRRMGWVPPQEVFPAETCARLVYFGAASAFSGFDAFLRDARAYADFRGRKAVNYYVGRSAYTFAVSFMAGLMGRERFDKEAAFHVRQGWTRYRTEYPVSSKPLVSTMDSLLHDSALIKSSMLEKHMRRPTLVNAAVEAAELTSQDTALIFGGAVPLSLEMIGALGHAKKGNPGAIVYAHHDAALLSEVRQAVASVTEAHRRITIPLRFETFAQAMEHSMAAARAVFVGLPIVEKSDAQRLGTKEAERNLQANENLCAAWKDRCCRAETGKLVHLVGKPEAQAALAGGWLDLADDPHFVSAQDLRRVRSTHFCFMDAVRAKAFEAITIMAAARYDTSGAQNVNKIAFDPQTLHVTYGLSRPSRGRALEQKQAQEAAFC